MGGFWDWIQARLGGLEAPLTLILILAGLLLAYVAGPPWFLAAILASVALLLRGDNE